MELILRLHYDDYFSICGVKHGLTLTEQFCFTKRVLCAKEECATAWEISIQSLSFHYILLVTKFVAFWTLSEEMLLMTADELSSLNLALFKIGNADVT